MNANTFEQKRAKVAKEEDICVAERAQEFASGSPYEFQLVQQLIRLAFLCFFCFLLFKVFAFSSAEILLKSAVSRSRMC